MNEKELLKLKKKVDAAEYDTQKLKGEEKAILANLKEDFACSTIEQAKAARKKLKKKRDQQADIIQSKLEEINKQYIPDEESE